MTTTITITKTVLDRETKKAKMRLRNIEKKFKRDRDKKHQFITLRIDRMTKLHKLEIFRRVLWKAGYRIEAGYISKMKLEIV
jgi:hypothetical protein